MSHHHMFTSHSSRPVADPEAYHRFLDHNKHLLLQIKMSVIVFIGGIIIAACVAYIFFQCKTRVVRPLIKQAQNRRTPKEEEDKRTLFGSNDTLENLLPSDKNIIPLKIRKDTEFYV